MGMTRKKASPKRRSECPLNASVEMLGDRWSLLIIRDMMLRGFRSYKEFMQCYEGIATNILADRLRKLMDYGIIAAETGPVRRAQADLFPYRERESIWRRCSRKWCSGPPRMKIPAIKPSSSKCGRIKQKFLAGIRQRWADRRSQN